MPQFCRNAHACIIMVDITNKASLEGAVRWKETVDRQALLPNGNSVPCLLLANKVQDIFTIHDNSTACTV